MDTEVKIPGTVTFLAMPSAFRTGQSGGYRLVLDIPEASLEDAKRLLEFINQNTQVAIVRLPE